MGYLKGQDAKCSEMTFDLQRHADEMDKRNLGSGGEI